MSNFCCSLGPFPTVPSCENSPVVCESDPLVRYYTTTKQQRMLFWFTSSIYNTTISATTFPVSEMTYTVSSGTLNSTIPYQSATKPIQTKSSRCNKMSSQPSYAKNSCDINAAHKTSGYDNASFRQTEIRLGLVLAYCRSSSHSPNLRQGRSFNIH